MPFRKPKQTLVGIPVEVLSALLSALAVALVLRDAPPFLLLAKA